MAKQQASAAPAQKAFLAQMARGNGLSRSSSHASAEEQEEARIKDNVSKVSPNAATQRRVTMNGQFLTYVSV